jgi:hypothetical protein
MALGPVFYAIAAIWAMAMILNLLTAARICAVIEQRSGAALTGRGLPTVLNVVPAAFNVGVAPDEETQELRRQMNKRLFFVVGGFVAFFIFMRLWTGAEP